MDLDLSVSARYAHYPRHTQDDEFDVTLAPEGVFGSASLAFDVTPFIRSVLYDAFSYRTDYVDSRGLLDRYGGREYRYIDNTVGLNTDWQFAKNKDILLALSREDFLPRSTAFRDQTHVTYREVATYEQGLFITGLIGGLQALYAQTHFKYGNRADWNEEQYTAYLRFAREGERGAQMRLTQVTSFTVGVGYGAGYARQVQRTVATTGTPVQVAEPEGRQGTLVGYAKLVTRLRKDTEHTLSYARGLRTGFDSAYEIYDEYAYKITWQGSATRITGYTTYQDVEPSSPDVNGYSDWISGVDLTHPLTQSANLFATSYYDARNNRTAVSANADPEWTNNYATWVSRIGTSLTLTKSIDFVTYFEHVERYSASSQLAYSRDVFEATFYYRHQF